MDNAKESQLDPYQNLLDPIHHSYLGLLSHSQCCSLKHPFLSTAHLIAKSMSSEKRSMILKPLERDVPPLKINDSEQSV